MPSGTCCLRRDTSVVYHHTFTLSSLFLIIFIFINSILFFVFLPLGNQTRSTSFSNLPLDICQPSARESWSVIQRHFAGALRTFLLIICSHPIAFPALFLFSPSQCSERERRQDGDGQPYAGAFSQNKIHRLRKLRLERSRESLSCS